LRRRKEILDVIAARIAAGMIGESVGGEFGLLPRATPPFTVEQSTASCASAWLRTSSLDDDHAHDGTGDRQWQISF
jgi:hypothetical protein